MEGDVLTLSEDVDTGFGFVNRFTVLSDGFAFQEENSDNFLYVALSDGEKFFIASK